MFIKKSNFIEICDPDFKNTNVLFIKSMNKKDKDQLRVEINPIELLFSYIKR